MRTKSPAIPFRLNVKSPLKSTDDNQNSSKHQQQETRNAWTRKRKRTKTLGLKSALNIAEDSSARDLDKIVPNNDNGSGTDGKQQDEPAKVSDSRVEMDVDGIDFFERVVCVICNTCEGESLLVCCVTGCPISLHAKCLPSSPKFDDGGNYYCPYCWYKREYDKARDLKEKVKLRKKEFMEFMAGKLVDNNKEKRDFRQCDCPEEQGDGVSGENKMNTVCPVGDGNTCCHDREDSIPSVGLDSHVSVQKSSKSSAIEGNKKTVSADEVIDEQFCGGNIRMTEDGAEKETDDKLQLEQLNEESPEASVSYREVAEPKCSDMSDFDSLDNEILALRQKRIAKQKKLNRGVAEPNGSVMSDMDSLDNEILASRQKRIAKQKKLNTLAMPQNSGSTEISLPEKDNTRNQMSDGKNKKASPAKPLGRSQESARGMKLVFQSERRKPLKWSVEEEDKLMELMAKFSSAGGRRIPWSKILQKGEGVFHNSRRPDDIKEKWRVMERNDEVLTGSR